MSFCFPSVAMFLLRRLPRDAANFLDISCDYKQVPYRDGWNVVHRSGPGPKKFWVYISANGSRVSSNAPSVDADDIAEVVFPFEKLDQTIIWNWLTRFAAQHSHAEWARNLVHAIERIDANFDDPPSETQLGAAYKLASFELLINGIQAEAQPDAILNLLLSKYIDLEAAGETTSLLLAQCLANLAMKTVGSLDTMLRLREEFVEFIDQIIRDRIGQPPRTFALLTHLASLYGFTAMKISAEILGSFHPTEKVSNTLRRSDAYVDEQLVRDVQTHTIAAAATPIGNPLRNEDTFRDVGSSNAPEMDVITMLRDRYWPTLPAAPKSEF